MRVLISAYACEPNKGSEPEVGLRVVLAAARDHDVWVMTRANNVAPLKGELLRAGVAERVEVVGLSSGVRSQGGYAPASHSRRENALVSRESL